MYYQTEMAPAYRTAVSPMYLNGTPPMTTPEMAAASPTEKALWARVNNGNNNGRDVVGWPPEIWDRIDRAVHDEICRVGIARRFLDLKPAPDATTVPAETFEETSESETAPVVLSINEAAVEAILEISAGFSLTPQQIASEETLHTAETLAIVQGNRVAFATDLVTFSGDTLARDNALFRERKIQFRAGPGPRGLANVVGDPGDSRLTTVEVDLLEGKDTDTYGDNIFTKVMEAYSLLVARGHTEPYALVVPTFPFGDSFGSLENTPIPPADRLQHLLGGRYYGTDALPQNKQLGEDPSRKDDVGVLLSLGGNKVKLVYGKAAYTEFLLQDTAGNYQFQIKQRVAVLDTDPTARVALLFERPGQQSR